MDRSSTSLEACQSYASRRLRPRDNASSSPARVQNCVVKDAFDEAGSTAAARDRCRVCHSAYQTVSRGQPTVIAVVAEVQPRARRGRRRAKNIALREEGRRRQRSRAFATSSYRSDADLEELATMA